MALSLEKAQSRKKSSRKKAANSKKQPSKKTSATKVTAKKVKPWQSQPLTPVQKIQEKPRELFSEHEELLDEGMNIYNENTTQQFIDNITEIPWQSIRHPRQTADKIKNEIGQRAKTLLKSILPF